MKKNILIALTLILGFVLITNTVGATGQSTTHVVFCQETGNGWKIVKGDDPSDNKRRVEVGTWNEHERGEGWNKAKATEEFLSKCPKDVVVTPDPETPKPKECPAGTTLVDYEGNDKQKPICKGDPTGCPYADQIPVDSPKCAPPVEVESTTSTPVEYPVFEEFAGK